MSGKFRDKETGVEGYLRANRYMEYQIEDEKGVPINGSFKTLSELLEKWEEIEEEPKDFWYIGDLMIICGTEGEFTTPDLASFTKKDIEKLKAIGNYFESKEEAEKAVERLKAWKRLEDKGFRFEGRYKPNYGEIFTIRCRLPKDTLVIDVAQDLDLLFSQEDD